MNDQVFPARSGTCKAPPKPLFDSAVVVGVFAAGASLYALYPYYAAATTTLFLVLCWRHLRATAVALAIFFTVMNGWRTHIALLRFDAAEHAARSALPSPSVCTLQATVVRSPTPVGSGDGWRLTVHPVGNVDCGEHAAPFHGNITIYADRTVRVRTDDIVDVVATIAPKERFRNDSDDGFKLDAARRNVFASGTALAVTVVRRGATLWSAIDDLRYLTRDRIEATFTPEAAPMARALVLGDSNLPSEDDKAFRDSGLSHLLAVSGMHLVVVVVAFYRALRFLLARVVVLASAMDPSRPAALVTIGATWAYAVFAGASGSAVRASVMLSLQLAATALGGRSCAIRTFGLSLFGMATVNCLCVADISFVLSATATFGLIFANEPWRASLERVFPSFTRALAPPVAATLAATVACAPFLASMAPSLPLAGVVANVIAVPLGELAALPLCLAHTLLGFWPEAERGCALAASGALTAVTAIARIAANVPWLNIPVSPLVPAQWCLLAVSIPFLATCNRRSRASVGVTVVAMFLLCDVGAHIAGKPTGVLRATFLDVGQGDAALIDLPDGSGVLVDAGGFVGSPVDTGARVIAPFLRHRRRSKLAFAVLSHPHPDHFTGLRAGLRGLSLGGFWDTGQGEDESTGGDYAAWMTEARTRRLPIVHPENVCGTRILGGAEWTVLSPCPSPVPGRNANDNSFVFRIRFGDRSILFTGDAELEAERELVAAAAPSLHADVLKVGHHGSRTSTSEAFLAAVNPQFAAISCGIRNRFGHPHATTLERLARHGVNVFRTDRDGAIVATTDGRTIEVHPLNRH